MAETALSGFTLWFPDGATIPNVVQLNINGCFFDAVQSSSRLRCSCNVPTKLLQSLLEK